MKSVRMADIAERLGISVVSVSKGLSGKDGVSEEMRARIQATAREMGYKTPAAPAETTGGKTIGVLVQERFFSESTFYSNLYRELVKQCSAGKDFAMMEIVTHQAEAEAQTPVFISQRKVDGLILMGQLTTGYLAMIAQCGLPYLLLDSYREGVQESCVVSDNVTGGCLLTRHLLEQGCRDIAFVGSIWATTSIMDRYLGYVKALRQAGLTPQEDWLLEDRNQRGDFVTVPLPEQMPQAFVCSCDEVAYRLVRQLIVAGYRVPEDVAVTGYDDYGFSTISTPPLTSYRVDTESMARLAVERIRSQMAGTLVSNSIVTVPGRLVPRASTGAAEQGAGRYGVPEVPLEGSAVQ
ncbi:MAG: LacI family DNA-binding transcriptional regulator [Clostridiales bacterium]|nr:LacI family DNA-binding transcriptional regulator [Clostridiales bacterium]